MNNQEKKARIEQIRAEVSQLATQTQTLNDERRRLESELEESKSPYQVGQVVTRKQYMDSAPEQVRIKRFTGEHMVGSRLRKDGSEGRAVTLWRHQIVTEADMSKGRMNNETPKVWGYVSGGNLYERAYFQDNLGLHEQEPWYRTAAGVDWSAFDVSFRPDDPDEFKAAYEAAKARRVNG